MIKVTDRFYITANANCYTLQEKRKVLDVNSENYGKDTFKELGYYSTLESCLKGILTTTTREYIGREDKNNIYELQKQINKANDFLQSLKLDI